LAAVLLMVVVLQLVVVVIRGYACSSVLPRMLNG
jgi:hypothetical protein